MPINKKTSSTAKEFGENYSDISVSEITEFAQKHRKTLEPYFRVHQTVHKTEFTFEEIIEQTGGYIIQLKIDKNKNNWK